MEKKLKTKVVTQRDPTTFDFSLQFSCYLSFSSKFIAILQINMYYRLIFGFQISYTQQLLDDRPIEGLTHTADSEREREGEREREREKERDRCT